MTPEEWTYLTVLLFSIPIGFVFKKGGHRMKQFGGAAVGLLLTLVTCNIHTLHSLVTILGTWVILSLSPRSCHYLTLGWTFSYLLFFRMVTFFGLPAPTPFTNAVQLLLTLKMVSLANEVQEISQAKKQDVTSFTKGPALGLIPSPVNIRCLQYNPIERGLVSYFTYLMDLLSGTLRVHGGSRTCSMVITKTRPWISWASPITSPGLSAERVGLLLRLPPLDRPPGAVHLLKRSLVGENGELSTYSHKVFAGWDFCLAPGTAAAMKHNSLRYELRMDLEEQTLRRLMAQRSPGQRLALFSLRGAVNLLVLGLLGAAFYGVYRATEYSQRAQQDTSPGQQGLVLGLLVAYLPSIVITAANQLVPLAFGLLVRLERYPLSLEIRLTLLRTVFLRLSSLLVLLFSLWTQITCHGDPAADSCRICRYNHQQHPCWETSVGQEMYKLLVFDLLVVLLVLLLVEFPRKLLVTHGPAPWPGCWGSRSSWCPPTCWTSCTARPCAGSAPPSPPCCPCSTPPSSSCFSTSRSSPCSRTAARPTAPSAPPAPASSSCWFCCWAWPSPGCPCCTASLSSSPPRPVARSGVSRPCGAPSGRPSTPCPSWPGSSCSLWARWPSLCRYSCCCASSCST
ncbi:unnamed protein product [Natator depressus]